jgi:hypothetical protein
MAVFGLVEMKEFVVQMVCVFAIIATVELLVQRVRNNILLNSFVLMVVIITVLFFFYIDLGCYAGGSLKCENGGFCKIPGICECKNGYTGKTCSKCKNKN